MLELRLHRFAAHSRRLVVRVGLQRRPGTAAAVGQGLHTGRVVLVGHPIPTVPMAAAAAALAARAVLALPQLAGLSAAAVDCMQVDCLI